MGILTLNNPKALNSLNIDMIWSVHDFVRAWEKNDSVKAILINSSTDVTGRPAFSSGGDVKFLYEESMAGRLWKVSNFFWNVYQLNYTMGNLSKPTISLWDGIVMGGATGISVHGPYRVATERSLFAMPETAIGFFPDTGSMYWMPRILGTETAKYVALTGQRLLPEDLVYSGIATHYVPSKYMGDLQASLIEATASETPVNTAVAQVLEKFHLDIGTEECNLVKNRSKITAAFKGDTMEEIFETLESFDDEFSLKTLETLKRMSPTALKVTLEGLKRGAAASDLAEDLRMEYRMIYTSALPGGDLYEGVRSVLVNRNEPPNWNPSRIEDVTAERVAEFFSPLDEELPVPPSSCKL